MCINSVKETCFSQKYQKWICLIWELNSSILQTPEHFLLAAPSWRVYNATRRIGLLSIGAHWHGYSVLHCLVWDIV